MDYGSEKMKDLVCNRVTVASGNAMPGECGGKECIIHIVSGKANLVIGPDGEQQWKYPLDAYDTVWIPAGTSFALNNDGIGNLEIAHSTYTA